MCEGEIKEKEREKETEKERDIQRRKRGIAQHCFKKKCAIQVHSITHFLNLFKQNKQRFYFAS